jgi:hypothetical protein
MKQSLPNLKYYRSNCPEGLRKTMKKLRHDSQSQGQDLSLRPPKHKTANLLVVTVLSYEQLPHKNRYPTFLWYEDCIWIRLEQTLPIQYVCEKSKVTNGKHILFKTVFYQHDKRRYGICVTDIMTLKPAALG